MQARLFFARILLFTVSPVWLALAQQSSQTGAFMSDRDKAGLRGPVKTVIEQQTFSGADGQQSFTTTTTTRYAPDGRILEVRMGNPDDSGWATSYTYYPDGRLRKTASGKANSAPSSETTYLYDDAQRLVGAAGDKVQVRYQYDDKGRKTAIESYDSQPLAPNTAYAAHWEGTDLGFATYLGGTVTTSYNDRGVATGAEFRDAAGKLLGHIVRKFDAEGRVVAVQQFADAPHDLMLPEEIRSKFNPEQLKAVGTFAAGVQNRINSYSYDAQGRVTERHRSGGPFDDEVTITKYNDHGDKASEQTTTVMNPEAGRQYSLSEAGAMIPVGQPNPPQPPAVYETQYTYQYDAYGNWTEQTTAGRSDSGAPFEPGSVRRRKLTYY